MAKKKKEDKPRKPDVHDDLKGFNIKINEFGEIITSFEVDQLNTFLNENLEDKKLSESQTEEE